jgi:hypothetical protein
MATCKTCGKKIRQPKDMSAGAAARIHYWRFHREVMMRGVRAAAERAREEKASKTIRKQREQR